MTEDDDDEAFDEFMEGIREEFRSGLPAHDAGLAEALALWRTGNAEHRPGAFRHMIERAHKLSGCGRTFGYPDIGDAAEALETALVEVSGALASAPPAKVLDLAAQLRAAIADVVKVSNRIE